MSIPEDFAALRDRDRSMAPSVDAMLARPAPARRTSPLLYALPAAAAVALAAAFVLFVGEPMRRAEPPPMDHVASVPSNPEPLGFLLDEPAVLARVPDFDSSPIKDQR